MKTKSETDQSSGVKSTGLLRLHQRLSAQTDTHSVVDDIDLQVDDTFGRTGQLLIFQHVALLLAVTDLPEKEQVGLIRVKLLKTSGSLNVSFKPASASLQTASMLHARIIRGWPPSPGSQHSCLCPHRTPSPPAQSGCLSRY